MFITCVNKQLGGFPGLSIVGVKKNYWNRIKDTDEFTYLSLRRYYQYGLKNQTPTTAPTQIYEHFLTILRRFDIDELRNKINRNSELIVDAIGKDKIIGESLCPVITIPKEYISDELAVKWNLYGLQTQSKNYQIFTYSCDDKDYENFVEENKIEINRTPHKPNKFLKLIKILIPVVLFMIEISLNFDALKDTTGLAQARYLSFTVAAINVGLSFLLGYLVLTHLLNKVQTSKSPRILFYGFWVFLYGLVMVWLNLMLGVFRSLTKAADEATTQKLEQTLTNDAFTKSVYPFNSIGEITFDGAFLLFMGMFFALITMIDGYFFRDPIPGYQSVGDRVLKAQARVQKLINHDRVWFGIWQSRYEQDLEITHQNRVISIKEWRKYVNVVQQLDEDFEDFIEQNKNTLKFVDPETPTAYSMINILNDSEKLFQSFQDKPEFYHVIEKSMYAAISEEMLAFFAGVVDFNNVILPNFLLKENVVPFLFQEKCNYIEMQKILIDFINNSDRQNKFYKNYSKKILNNMSYSNNKSTNFTSNSGKLVINLINS